MMFTKLLFVCAFHFSFPILDSGREKQLDQNLVWDALACRHALICVRVMSMDISFFCGIVMQLYHHILPNHIGLRINNVRQQP